MMNFRRDYVLESGTNLQMELKKMEGTPNQKARKLLGTNGRRKLSYYMEMGHMLMALRREFYKQWSMKAGTTVPAVKF